MKTNNENKTRHPQRASKSLLRATCRFMAQSAIKRMAKLLRPFELLSTDMGQANGGSVIEHSSQLLSNLKSVRLFCPPIDTIKPNSGAQTRVLWRRTVMALILMWCASVPSAWAQELITNGNFSSPAQLTFGNHLGVRPTGWSIGGGQRPNLVRVNGIPGGGGAYGYGFNTNVDALGGAGQYLDIDSGSNDFWQVFTVPGCTTGVVSFSGYFSYRAFTDGSPAEGGPSFITIRKGSGATGEVVSSSVVLPNSPFATQTGPDGLLGTADDNTAQGIDEWAYSPGSVILQPGTYSYVVSMGNFANFDQASAVIVPEPIIDTDGDGLGDACDLDDDNDGILDTVESNCKIGFIDDFGTGTTRVSTPYINSSNYTFAATGRTESGSYTIARAARPDAADFPNWSTDPDHTPGDTNGRMLIVNAGAFPGEFYRREVSNIISGRQMQFNFWARNVVFTSAAIRPNIKINLEDSAGNVVYTSTTGDLLESQGWRNFSGSIFATDTSYTLVLINNNGGGSGNDLALDDIEFSQSYCDTDNDGIPDDKDSDSDGDGCPDTLEGAAGFTYANTVDGTGGPDIDKPLGPDASLGDNVGANAGTDQGIPALAGTGQGEVSSKDASVQASACLISLPPPSCVPTTSTSYFKNADFEARSGCPTNLSQTSLLDDWEQATEGTSDYYNTCGYMGGTFDATSLLPFPSGQGSDGNSGAVGFITSRSKDTIPYEYVGQCLKQPLLAGTEYTLSFYAGSPVLGPTTVFAGNYTGILELIGVDGSSGNCPTPQTGILSGRDYKADKAGFTLLATSAPVTFTEGGDWQVVTMSFTPTADLQYVMLGASVPLSDPDPAPRRYTMIDGLVLDETKCSDERFDFGDAPTFAGIKTLEADDGAMHLIRDYNETAKTSVIMLGNSMDDEADGQPAAAANLDTYDDAVTDFQAYQGPGGMTCSGVNGTYTTRARQYCVTVKVTNNDIVPAQLVGWFDYDMNQSFTDNERSLADLGGNGTSVFVADADGNPADSSYSTGNIPAGFSGDVVLVFAGLGLRAQPDSQTYARFRLTSAGSGSGLGFFSATSAPSPNGAVANGEVEDYVISAGTLPVSLSHFDSALSGDTLKLDWGTASELFNSGFQLWGLDQASQQWQVLNQWLVASGGGNSAEPQSYSQSLSIPASITELESIGISSVDSDGSEHFYGPFEPGKAYGELLALEPIDWGEIRAQADTAMAALGYTRVHGQGYQLLASAADLSGDSAAQVTQFSVSGDGLYKLKAKQLLASGADWRDIPQGEIAVVNAQGQPISRHIVASGSGEGQDQTLGDRGYIVFYGQGVDQPSALYSGESVYRLQRDVSRVRRVPMQPRQGIGTQHSPSYIEQSWVEEQKHYLVNSVLADPWLSDVILSYPDRNRGALYTLPVEADAIADQGAKLFIRAGRSSALSAVDNNQDGLIDPEHILRGIVMTPNSSPGYLLLDEHRANGRGAWSVDYSLAENLDLSAGQLRVGALFKAGAGYQFSEAYIDAVGIAYSRPYVAKAGDNHLSFSAPNQGESSYRVEVPRVSGLVIYASDGPNLVRLNNEALQFVRYADGRRAIRTSFAALQGANALGQSDSIRYWVANGRGYLSVKQIAPVQVRAQAELLDAASASDYLIIAHPSFMGESLTRFANHKRAMGHQVQVVDYLEIVNSFAGGQSGPQGLTDYLLAVEQASGGALAHVLLVGGSTYDHRNYLASDAITFIPSHYGVSMHSRHTPSDSLYVQDANGDLFAAIGRWPVRSAAELETLVANTLQWDNQTIEAPSALLVGDRTLEGEYIEFGQALDNLSAHLPSDYLQNKIYLSAALPAEQAKPLIKAGLNQAPQLVVYNGHASTSRLGKDSLYQASDAADTQAASPALWLPLSCYMTYFESTSVNTLAHQLLFSGQTVAISGAVLLSSQSSNLSMGKTMLDSLGADNSLGASINQAKQALNNPATSINWSLLGDPSIGLQ